SSSMNLSSLQQITGGNVQFTLDSAVDLTSLTGISGGTRFRPTAGMTLNLSSLTNFNGSGTWTRGEMTAANGGTITAPILGSLQSVNLQLNEGSTISLGQGLAGSASLAMNSVDITYQGAATLNLPKLSSFTNGTLVL